MFVLERLLDDLGKEAKEAPGWISVWTLCNGALYFIDELPIIGPIGNDRVTIATCGSIVLFFIGDMIDIALFPRRRDPERAEKLVRNTMMISAALGFFLLFSGKVGSGVLAWAPWGLLWPLHQKLSATGGAEPGDDSKTGWSWLAPKSLDTAQAKAKTVLGVQAGVYAVSKALAKRAGTYVWRPWLANEASKFFRSLVVPVAALALGLFSARLPLWGLMATATAIALLFAYARLKAWHMRRLYDLAASTLPLPARVESGVSVMTWNGQAVAYCVNGRWREVATNAPPTPYPSKESLMT